MNWDAFIGPAKFRPYHSIYTPWNFRGWWDFGSGALGDMANHILQVAFKGLNLGYPSEVIGSSTMLMTDACPSAQKITYRFPARPNMPRLAMPPVELNWYDGGLQPNLPIDMPEGRKFDPNGVTVFYGTKDTMVVGTYGYDPFLVSGRNPQVPERCRIVKDDNHHQDWIRACKETPATRVKSSSDFSESGPLNEMIVMGVAAVRLQSLNQWLKWDGENMKFTNIPANAKIRTIIGRTPHLRPHIHRARGRQRVCRPTHQAGLPRRLQTARTAVRTLTTKLLEPSVAPRAYYIITIPS